MKHLLRLSPLSLCLLALVGCETHQDDPTASFEVTNEGCNAPCEIVFTNTSQDAWEFLWDFGDGTTSTEREPSHVYPSGPSGEGYEVTLMATGREKTVTTTRLVRVGQQFTRFIIDRVQVRVLKATRTAGGDPWDDGPEATSHADIIFDVFDPTESVICSSPIVEDLKVEDLPYDYTNVGCTLNFINAEHILVFYDEDTTSRDTVFVPGLTFTPFDYKSEQANQLVKFDLNQGAGKLRATVFGTFQ